MLSTIELNYMQKRVNINKFYYSVYATLFQESLDDVGTELHEMREELHKLMGVIESKDHAIETLENQLRTSKDQIKHK